MSPTEALEKALEFSPWITLAIVAFYGSSGGIMTNGAEGRRFRRSSRAATMPLPHTVDVTTFAKRLMLISAGLSLLRIGIFAAFAAIAQIVPTDGSMAARAAWYLVPPLLVIGLIATVSQCVQYRRPFWIGTGLKFKAFSVSIIALGSFVGAATIGVGLLCLSTAVEIVVVMGMVGYAMGPSSISLAGGLFILIVACVPAILGWVLLQCSCIPSRFARRLLQPAIGEVLRDFPPVTLLRSFEDDTLVTPTPPGGAALVESFASESQIRFEELISGELWRTGPVVALGHYTQAYSAPLLGAVRDYFDDSDWQSQVVNLLGKSRLILVIIGQAPGLAWEYTQLRELGLLAKCIFVIPPISTKNLLHRRRILESALNLSHGVLDGCPGRVPISLQFDANGNPITICAAGREGRAYTAALRTGIKTVQKEGGAKVRDPASQYAASQDDTKQELIRVQGGNDCDPRRSDPDYHSEELLDDDMWVESADSGTASWVASNLASKIAEILKPKGVPSREDD